MTIQTATTEASKITASRVKSIIKPGRYWDTIEGHHILAKANKKGLALYWAHKLQPEGTINSTMRTFGRIDPKDKQLAKKVKQARADATARVDQASKGVMPARKRSGRRGADSLPVPNSFEAMMLEVHSRKLANKVSRYRREWLQKMRLHAGPLMPKRIAKITTREIAETLDPIWETKHKTANDIKKAIKLVFDYAKGMGYYQGDNPAGDPLEAVLSDYSHKVKHHRSLPYQDVAAALNKIIASSSRGPVTGCLLLIALTGVRSQEARGARWTEIDWQTKTWTIPASRTKKRRDHIVPLSSKAIDVLQAQLINSSKRVEFRITFTNDVEYTPINATNIKSQIIFPGRKGKQLSAAALSESCNRNELGCSPHGFRSSFRTWCQDTGQDREASELCLAHRIGDSTEQAYASGQILHKRREIMQAWADYLHGSAS